MSEKELLKENERNKPRLLQRADKLLEVLETCQSARDLLLKSTLHSEIHFVGRAVPYGYGETFGSNVECQVLAHYTCGTEQIELQQLNARYISVPKPQSPILEDIIKAQEK